MRADGSSIIENLQEALTSTASWKFFLWPIARVKLSALIQLWHYTTCPWKCPISVDLFRSEWYGLDKPGPYKTFTLSGQDWMSFNDFAIQTNMSLLFDLNAFFRRNDSSWDPDNARKLLKFSSWLDYKHLSFQLGNEPNSYKHKWGIRIPGKQLGNDFRRLRRVLSQFPQYENSTGYFQKHFYMDLF